MLTRLLMLTLILSPLLAACGPGASLPPLPGAVESPRLSAASVEEDCPSCGKSAYPGQRFWMWRQPSSAVSAPMVAEDLTSLDGGLAQGYIIDVVKPSDVFSAEPLLHLAVGAHERSFKARPLRPLACAMPGTAARPGFIPLPSAGSDGRYRDGWHGGAVRLTGPLPLAAGATDQQLDEVCAAAFGPDWRILRDTETVDFLPVGALLDDVWSAGPAIGEVPGK